ncbi:MAG TPA: alpha/beta hydrolase [Ktedonobacteraceae bacterium]|nr:alpha/beta hydrolase [Ktedonobacteraceae bacterium]
MGEVQSDSNQIPSHWFEGSVVANGIHQHYYRTGGDHRSLLLLHGFTDNALSWSRVARALERDYDVIMVDARGHGLSDGPESGYAQELLTQDVIGLIYELGIERPVLMGHSNGALTAASVAANAPQLVRAMILEDPPWSEASASFPAMTAASGDEPWPGFTAWYNGWIAWHKALRSQTAEERIAASQRFLPPGAANWPDEEMQNFLEGQAQFNLDVLNFTPFIPTRTPWRDTVERIECPILLLTGSQERGTMVTPEEAQKIAAAWRKGQHVSFAETGHFMHRELQGKHFDTFVNVVKKFLAEA